MRNLALNILFATTVSFFPMSALAKSFSVDLSNLMLTPGERIVGFDIKVVSGYVSAITAPPGWQIHVDNQPSEYTEVSGSVFVGAAALNYDNLNEMVTVTQISNPGQTFQLTGNIIVTKDFEHTRTLTLIPGNISLRPTK